jgi:hypothetical protein
LPLQMLILQELYRLMSATLEIAIGLVTIKLD